MSGDYDTIVIGAGHNGLVCAAYLAQKGQRVLVLERADAVGGLAREQEFHAGFRAPLASHVDHFPERIIRELKLETHGLEIADGPLPLVALAEDGNHVSIGSQVNGVGEHDAAAWRNYRPLMERFAAALEPFWLKTIPRIRAGSLADNLTFAHVGWNLRRLGKNDMREFLRVVSLPMRDLMDENFDNDLLKAALSFHALAGMKMAPRSPNGAVLMMLYRNGGRRVSGVVPALRSAAEAAGVEIRTGAAVNRIDTIAGEHGPVASGVRLELGEFVGASRIVSSADPKTTFFGLVGVENLEIGFSNRIRRLRTDGLVARLNLGLDGLPEFRGLDDPGGRLVAAPDMEAIEISFDAAKYGELPERPVLDMSIPSLASPSLAPEGHHILSANVMYVPHTPKGGWDDGGRAALTDSVIDTIERYAPGIRQRIVKSDLQTPADIEANFGVTGGHWHHAEFAMDQMLMMRPTYEAAQYATPVGGLYLCGAGCHPAGDVTGAAGHNAAHEILR